MKSILSSSTQYVLTLFQKDESIKETQSLLGAAVVTPTNVMCNKQVSVLERGPTKKNVKLLLALVI